MSTVYVSNFPFTTTASQLAPLFSVFGEIDGVRIAHRGDLPLGYGFVVFKTAEAFANCLSHPETVTLDGRPLKIEPANPQRDVEDNVFVHNIGQTVTLEQLKDHFREFHVVDAKIVCRYESEQRKGFAFVRVESKADRDAAVARLNLSVLSGRRIFVTAAASPFEHTSRRRFTNNRIRVPRAELAMGGRNDTEDDDGERV
jgi:RNA recognition motif-containing protein